MYSTKQQYQRKKTCFTASRIDLFRNFEIKNIMDKLVKIIKELPHDKAVDYLTGYVNDVAERVCRNAWRKSNHLLHWVANNKKRQLGDFKMEENPYSDTVSVIDFNRFYNAIRYKCKELAEIYPSDDVFSVLEEIEDYMIEKKSKLNTDGRSIIPFEKL